MKNIIFDFGNVLLNIDMDRFSAGMRVLLGDDTEPILKKLTAKQIFTLYETGGLKTDEFLAQIVAADPKGRLQPETVKEAWNSIFIGMPSHRFDMLLQLGRKYKVFLLSNINELHLEWIEEYLLTTHKMFGFEHHYFDGVYYSHLIRMRKPDNNIFASVLADAELKPEETCFFDDLPENIAAAQALGITGYWHDPKREIREHLETLGLM
jgi:glucose-1-phosphatase